MLLLCSIKMQPTLALSSEGVGEDVVRRRTNTSRWCWCSCCCAKSMKEKKTVVIGLSRWWLFRSHAKKSPKTCSGMRLNTNKGAQGPSTIASVVSSRQFSIGEGFLRPLYTPGCIYVGLSVWEEFCRTWETRTSSCDSRKVCRNWAKKFSEKFAQFSDVVNKNGGTELFWVGLQGFLFRLLGTKRISVDMQFGNLWCYCYCKLDLECK